MPWPAGREEKDHYEVIGLDVLQHPGGRQAAEAVRDGLKPTFFGRTSFRATEFALAVRRSGDTYGDAYTFLHTDHRRTGHSRTGRPMGNPRAKPRVELLSPGSKALHCAACCQPMRKPMGKAWQGVAVRPPGLQWRRVLTRSGHVQRGGPPAWLHGCGTARQDAEELLRIALGWDERAEAGGVQRAVASVSARPTRPVATRPRPPHHRDSQPSLAIAKQNPAPTHLDSVQAHSLALVDGERPRQLEGDLGARGLRTQIPSRTAAEHHESPVTGHGRPGGLP